MSAIQTAPAIESAGLYELGVSETRPSDADPVLRKQPHGVTLPKSKVLAKFLSVNSSQNSRPQQVLLGTIADPSLRVMRAIPLVVTVEESTVLVSWAEIDEFGSGSSMSEAIDDFSHALRELYNRINEGGVQLGPDLINVRATLENYVQRRPHESA